MEFLLCMADLGDYDIGDMIDIRDDGFNWGSGERDNPRFKLVRIADADVGLSLEEAKTKFFGPAISRCELCNKYVLSADVDAHLEASHADVLYDVLVTPPRKKSPEELNVTRVKNRRWIIDGHGFDSNQAEICEKVLASDDTVIAFATEKTVDITIL